LGAEVKQWTFSQDVSRINWAISSVQYVKEAIKNTEEHLFKQSLKLYPVHQPMHTEYRPELGITPWIVKLGRLDI
jgi:hypothetical protein